MKREDIINKVLNTEWELNEQFPTYEVSKTVPFWNANIAFMVHAVRLKSSPDDYVLVVTQIRPKKVHDITLDDLGIDWDDNDIKSMPGRSLLADEKAHCEFLNGM